MAGLIERVDDKEFRDCTRLQAIALDAQHRIPSYAYNLALIPKNSRTAFFTFPSDVSTAVPINWLSRYHPEKSAFASLYSVGSSYTFHCRDDQGRLTKSSGPEGDPLQLTLASGLAEIWHFSVFGKGMATVMVVTDVPLDRLEGQDLLDEATRRLRARIVLLYVRNDPWFFGYASDSLPYVFTDGYRRISEAEYRATRTMVCESHEGCKVVPSLYQ